MQIAIMGQKIRIINLHSNPVGYPYVHFQIKVKRRESGELSNSSHVVQPIRGRVKIYSTTMFYFVLAF